MRRTVLLTVPLVLAATLVGVSCFRTSDPPPASRASGQQSIPAPSARAPVRSVGAFAALPDRGDLLRYSAQPVRHENASTWYPADISEAHAFSAIVTGHMTITAPDGQPVRLRYQRHFEHPNGNWTWIGRDAYGEDAVLTFGEKAVFGSIPQHGREELRLSTRGGHAWVVQIDPTRLHSPDASKPDFLVPPSLVASLASSESFSASAQPQAVAAAATATVDVALGYTTGYATELGGNSQAVTRLQNLVDITNQAYANSQINAQVRLVRTMAIGYADATDNSDALSKLSGFKSGSGTVPIDPAFSALRAARDQYGADLVSFVRRFRTPENAGCGVAWLIGEGQSTINNSDAPFGYSVVSDDLDRGDFDESDGKTYGCRKESLAHEFGHNMGQTHNVEDNTGSGGAHTYSYGYRESTNTGFYTVMAYRLANSSQGAIRYFANPNVAYAGRPTGVANASDNARSMAQTMPLIAAFRAAAVPPPPTGSVPALFAISKLGASGFTEVHVLDGAAGYRSFVLQTPTSLGQTGNNRVWQFALNDRNRDGVADLYSILRQGTSGRTEIYVLDGARHFQTSLLQTVSILQGTGSGLEWAFLLGDYNRDGVADLYTIYKTGASGMTEVHVVDGATGFKSYLAHIATGLGQTGTGNNWQFELGDRNGDGVLDLYCINRTGATRTEVHVLDGARNFQVPLLQVATILMPTGTGNEWNFKLGDYNLDGVADLYVIYRIGASGMTELHILDGASNFTQFSAHIATALPSTGTDNSWDFELAP